MSRDTKQIQLPWLIQQRVINYIINDKRCGKRERNTLKIICSKYHRYIESCLEYEPATSLDLRYMNTKTHIISNSNNPNITLRFNLQSHGNERLYVWDDEIQKNECIFGELEYKEYLKLLSSKVKSLYFFIEKGVKENDIIFSISQLIKLIEMAKDNIQLISINTVFNTTESDQVEKSLCDLVDYCISDNLPNLVNFHISCNTKTVSNRIINLTNSSIKELSLSPYYLESGSFTHIESLTIFKGAGIDRVCSQFPNLKRLKKLFIPTLYEWDGVDITKLKSLSKLTKLYVSNIHHSSLVQILSQMSQLRVLKFAYYTKYYFDEGTPLNNEIHNNYTKISSIVFNNLDKLKIYYHSPNTSLISPQSNIKSLIIDGCTPSIDSVLQFLTVNTSLVDLRGILYNEEIGKIIASNRQLRTLSMVIEDFKYIENINTIFHYLIQCHSLQYVQLGVLKEHTKRVKHRVGDYFPLNENTSDSFKLVDKDEDDNNYRVLISFIRVCNIHK